MSETNKSQQYVVHTPEELCEHILIRCHQRIAEQRLLIAIAGPPGSGKSTLLAMLVDKLRTLLRSNEVIGLPMDGFHLDNSQLDIDGTGAVKGAPHTFDVSGLGALVRRLKAGESPVYAPEFDRASDLSRNCAIKVEHTHNVVLIEGNYLLLDQPGWQTLPQYFALTISIDVPFDILQDRLVRRWLDYGLSDEQAYEKALGNDIPNAKTVTEQSLAADIIYQPENNQ